jgi:hypothetical protein
VLQIFVDNFAAVYIVSVLLSTLASYTMIGRANDNQAAATYFVIGLIPGVNSAMLCTMLVIGVVFFLFEGLVYLKTRSK